ncbi:MAG TPA: hypothetical protein VHM20_01290, partial [Gammaproteobacteria bacterium]|nr:hypothetical protein [Gammaproteobacteria bacterium]
MMKMELLFNLTGINLNKLSRDEKFLFLSYLLTHLHRELFEKFKSHHQMYLQMTIQDLSMEDTMLEANFIKYLIRDILSTEEYSLAGIANYARIPEDVIYDLFTGLNKNPSSSLWNKVIELHSTVRSD